MIPGLYSAATALDAVTDNQEIIAENLAHANVPGYRQKVLSFETFDKALAGAGSTGDADQMLGTRKAKVNTVFTPGDIQYTGNSFDVALMGDSFFVVDGPRGPLYTRNGTFQLNSEGVIQTRGGLPVTGTGGPITIPQGTSQVNISEVGTVFADNTEVGQLKLARFQDPTELTPAGTTMFEAPTDVKAETPTSGVRQGYREGSNVQTINLLVQMIAGSRQYEAAQRAMRSLSDAVEMGTRPPAR